MKKIIIVSNTGWYLFNFRYRLIKDLVKNYDVTLVFPFDEFTDSFKKIDCKLINWNLKRNSINPFLEIYSLFKLIRIYKKINPQITHHFTVKPCLYGSIAARILGTSKVLNSITGLGHIFLAKKLHSFLYKLVMINIYKFAFNYKNSYLIFQNNEDKKFFINLKIISNKKSFLIRGSGVDTDFYKRKIKREIININKTINILFPARIIKEKGIMELIQACQSIRDENIDLKLNIPSDLNFFNRSFLSKFEIESLKKRSWINFLGYLDDTRPLYEKNHIVILPSWREGLSMSLLEASSMECAIITTNVPGCNDIVKHGKSGLLVPLNDPISINLAIKLLINNPFLIEKFGKNARENTRTRFNSDIVLKQTLDLYKK